MALIDELKQLRAEHVEKETQALADYKYFVARIIDFDRAIAALEPGEVMITVTNDEPSLFDDEIETSEQSELCVSSQGADPGGAEESPDQSEDEAVIAIDDDEDDGDDEPSEFISDLTGDPAVEPESGLHVWAADELEQLSAKADAFIAEIGAPQVSITQDPEPTELDAEPASVFYNPELLAAVQRAEAKLAAEPNYIGLQDADLDAEYDAMKAREEADKPKPRFNIFGRVKENA